MVDLPRRSGLPAALYKVLQLYSHQVGSSPEFPVVESGVKSDLNGIWMGYEWDKWRFNGVCWDFMLFFWVINRDLTWFEQQEWGFGGLPLQQVAKWKPWPQVSSVLEILDDFP